MKVRFSINIVKSFILLYLISLNKLHGANKLVKQRRIAIPIQNNIYEVLGLV
jgi:hypothetical protein